MLAPSWSPPVTPTKVLHYDKEESGHGENEKGQQYIQFDEEISACSCSTETSPHKLCNASIFPVTYSPITWNAPMRITGKSSWRSCHHAAVKYSIAASQVRPDSPTRQCMHEVITCSIRTSPLETPGTRQQPLRILYFLQNRAWCKLLAEIFLARSHQPQNAMHRSDFRIIRNQIFSDWKRYVQTLQLRLGGMILLHRWPNSQAVHLTIFARTPSWLCRASIRSDFANTVQIILWIFISRPYVRHTVRCIRCPGDVQGLTPGF